MRHFPPLFPEGYRSNVSHKSLGFPFASRRTHSASFTLWLNYCLQYTYILLQWFNAELMLFRASDSSLTGEIRINQADFMSSKKFNIITSRNKYQDQGFLFSGLSLLRSRKIPSYNMLARYESKSLIVLNIAPGRQSIKGQTAEAQSPFAVPNIISYHHFTL